MRVSSLSYDFVRVHENLRSFDLVALNNSFFQKLAIQRLFHAVSEHILYNHKLSFPSFLWRIKCSSKVFYANI